MPNWEAFSRAMQVLEEGFVKKINDEAWDTLLKLAEEPKSGWFFFQTERIDTC